MATSLDDASQTATATITVNPLRSALNGREWQCFADFDRDD
jgi:hypothetical protein